jgi:hypothetical protein
MRALLPSLLLLACPLIMFFMMFVMHRGTGHEGGRAHGRGITEGRGHCELESLQSERDRLAARVALLEVKLEELEPPAGRPPQARI